MENHAASSEDQPLKELESLARRAEESRSAESTRNAENRRKEVFACAAAMSAGFVDGKRRGNRRRMDLFGIRSWRFEEKNRRELEEHDEDEDDDEDEDGQQQRSGGATVKNRFLNRLRIKRRGMKLLSFLSGKSADRSQEERAARLLRMYLPEKSGRAQNTISIHHSSRDRRFWKLRSRRRASGTL